MYQKLKVFYDNNKLYVNIAIVISVVYAIWKITKK